MESLKDTSWDVVLSGTGLPQSLLALALSRSGKNVLHVDKNDYYGGSEAALSLQEAEAWVRTVNSETRLAPFHHASIEKPSQLSATTTLAFPRAYSLSLAPQLLYSRSNLLPTLVSSKVYRQLEFLAVGSWYIYQNIQETQNEQANSDSQPSQGQSFGLYKIPGGREDIFADKNIDLRSARSLMKFLKVAAEVDTHAELLSEWGSKPVSDYLSSQVGIPAKLQSLLLALTLSPNTPTETTTTFALPRIHRHLTSIGMFGPGFGSVLPKWGGLAEIAQVACRAGAVGGGVYVLNRAIESFSAIETTVVEASITDVNSSKSMLDIQLDNNEKVRAQWVVGTWDNLPQDSTHLVDEAPACMQRSISVISSPLSELFPHQVEGSPSLDAAVVVFPSESLDAEVHPPVYLMVHTSSTGECPAGQCVVYAHSTPSPSISDGPMLLARAVDAFLSSIHETPKPEVLWRLSYQHDRSTYAISEQTDGHVICMNAIPPDLVLEDDVLRNVRETWERIVGDDTGEGFMIFRDREGAGDDEPETE